MGNLTAIGMVALLLAGCAIPNSRSNSVVVTDNKAVIEGCAALGEVDGGAGSLQPILLDRARDTAVQRLKILAAERDGTHVLSEAAAVNYRGKNMRGTVYRCVR